MPREIQKIEIDFGRPEGTWTFNRETGGIGGKPLPSESQAHAFRETVIPAIEKLANMSLDDIKEFLDA